MDSNKINEYKYIAINTFTVSVISAVIQGGFISLYAMINELPTMPHKYYKELDGTLAFYVISACKHLCFIISLIASIIYMWIVWIHDNKKNNIKTEERNIRIFFIVLLIFMPMCIISLQRNEGLIILAGIKAFIPFGAVIIGFIFDKNDIKKISKLLDLLLYTNLIIAIFQKIIGIAYCGPLTYGCENIRSTGLFLEPNTMAAFAIAKILFVMVDGTQKNYFPIIASLILVILSGSRTMALLLTISIFFLIINNKNAKYLYGIFTIYSILVVVSVFHFRGFDISTKEGILTGFDSLIQKFTFYKFVSIDDILMGEGIGYGSQAHHLLKNSGSLLSEPPIADSQILSFIYQGGLWLLTSLLIASTYIYIKVNKKYILLLLTIFWLSSLTIMTVEVWPFNILLLILIAYAIRNDNLHEMEIHKKNN